MQYTYEFEVFESEGMQIAYPFDMEGATQGQDPKEVALMAADWLRSDIQHRLMHDIDVPEATFGNVAIEGGAIMIVSVEAGLENIERITASEAARRLSVTPARITHMIRDGLLDAFRDNHTTWVTVASVEARLSGPRKAGRPRKTVVV